MKHSHYLAESGHLSNRCELFRHTHTNTFQHLVIFRYIYCGWSWTNKPSQKFVLDGSWFHTVTHTQHRPPKTEATCSHKIHNKLLNITVSATQLEPNSRAWWLEENRARPLRYICEASWSLIVSRLASKQLCIHIYSISTCCFVC